MVFLSLDENHLTSSGPISRGPATTALHRLAVPHQPAQRKPCIFVTVQQYFARRGVLAPQHVSLVCGDHDPIFEWYSPSIAHIYWDGGKVAQRVESWAKNVARGKEDRRQSYIKAEFIEGGTMGPAFQMDKR